MIKPEFIAHRGYTRYYPENTLVSVEAALKAGAQYIEIDVQLTSDLIPVLFHDDDLQRVTGQRGNINDTKFTQLKNYKACEPARFKDLFNNVPITALAELVEVLHHWPNAKTFVEIKTESLDRFGVETVTQIILDSITPLKERCIPISYDNSALFCVKESGIFKTGWVIKNYNEKSFNIARTLLPDYLFCNHIKLPPAPISLWEGSWLWASYEITDPAHALMLTDRGIDMIETMEIGEMLQHPLIQDRLSRAERTL